MVGIRVLIILKTIQIQIQFLKKTSKCNLEDLELSL